jgi:hypothetical protein
VKRFVAADQATNCDSIFIAEPRTRNYCQRRWPAICAGQRNIKN